MAKKAIPPPPIDTSNDKEVIYLRVDKDTVKLIESIKKVFFEASTNKAMIRAIHDWHRLTLQNKDLKDALRESREQNERYSKAIGTIHEFAQNFKGIIDNYKVEREKLR